MESTENTENGHFEYFKNGFDGIRCQSVNKFYLIREKGVQGIFITNTCWNFLNSVYGFKRDIELFEKIEKQRVLTKLGDHPFDVNTINLTEEDLRKHRRSFLEICLHVDCDVLEKWIHFQAVRYNCYVIASAKDMQRNCVFF